MQRVKEAAFTRRSPRAAAGTSLHLSRGSWVRLAGALLAAVALLAAYHTAAAVTPDAASPLADAVMQRDAARVQALLRNPTAAPRCTGRRITAMVRRPSCFSMPVRTRT